MERIPRKGGHPGINSEYADGVGQTLDEIKLERVQLLPAEIAPLSTRQLTDLIGGTRSTDQLRLNVPEAANPFQASPLGPKQDYLILESVVRRSRSDLSRELVTQLQQGVPGVAEDSAVFMRASLAREHNMLQLLNRLMDSMGQIHHRIVGSQEG